MLLECVCRREIAQESLSDRGVIKASHVIAGRHRCAATMWAKMWVIETKRGNYVRVFGTLPGDLRMLPMRQCQTSPRLL